MAGRSQLKCVMRFHLNEVKRMTHFLLLLKSASIFSLASLLDVCVRMTFRSYIIQFSLVIKSNSARHSSPWVLSPDGGTDGELKTIEGSGEVSVIIFPLLLFFLHFFCNIASD
jgi:hypothetical protein